MPLDLPRELHEFVRLFNARRFWDSHEALEGPWREHGSEFYHGLILYASAFVHVQRGNPHGIVAQLGKAERALDRFRPTYLGIDVDALLSHAAAARRLVEGELDEPDLDLCERVTAPLIRLEQRFTRGTEPELPG